MKYEKKPFDYILLYGEKKGVDLAPSRTTSSPGYSKYAEVDYEVILKSGTASIYNLADNQQILEIPFSELERFFIDTRSITHTNCVSGSFQTIANTNPEKIIELGDSEGIDVDSTDEERICIRKPLDSEGKETEETGKGTAVYGEPKYYKKELPQRIPAGDLGAGCGPIATYVSIKQRLGIDPR